jgi:hypothetical protein
MKPVCDHPGYCKKDKQSLYIGQRGFMSYPPHRHYSSYVPSGFRSISYHWDGLCNYGVASASARYSQSALCNMPYKHSHNTYKPSDADPGFVCGKCLSGGCHIGAPGSVAAKLTLDKDIATIGATPPPCATMARVAVCHACCTYM